MSRRRKPSWVYLEWEELVLDKGSRLTLEEREARWQDLLRRTYFDGAWHITADEAHLVATLGRFLSLEAGDVSEALARIQSLFQHPDFPSGEYRTLDKTTYWSAVTSLAHDEIACGFIEQGLSRLEQLLAEIRPPRTARNMARFGLPATPFVNKGSPADPRLVRFARNLLLRSRGCKTLAHSLEEGMSVGELEEILFATHGR